MPPSPRAQPEYVAAFTEIAARIAATLEGAPKRGLPVRMYVAGGAALHFYTGERVSRDIDASFSHRLALPDDLEAAFRDSDGAARLLYFDRQYNDTLGLLHEDAHEDSKPLKLERIDSRALDVRLLTPLDLAVSKIGRFSQQDRDDIAALARNGLISATKLRRRAEEAVRDYVGNTARVQGSIELACRIVNEGLDKRRT